MNPQFKIYIVCFTCFLGGVGSFAPSIDIPPTTTDPPPTTPDPATLPHFLHHINSTNVTVSRGKAAVLNCHVFRLRDRTVSWVRRQGGSIQLLTIGSSTYQNNGRYQLVFEEPNNWRLVVTAAQETDRGHYECQVSSHPPKIKRVHLSVYVPRLEIFDARGEAVIQEKFYELGSSIDLRCDAFHVTQDAVVWSRGGAVVYHSPETGIRVETTSGNQGPVSWLRVKAAATSDSGNYSCTAADADPATIRIQVLEGNTSAAMQHSTNTSAAAYRAARASVTTIIHLLTFSLVLWVQC